MDKNKKCKKQLSMSYLNWYLSVGRQLGTLSKSKARQLLGVNQHTFHKWITGKSIAPLPVLIKIRLHSLGKDLHMRRANYKDQQQFKLLNNNLSVEEIKSRFYWKHALLNELSVINRRKVFMKEKLRSNKD